jgi:hypothetical protein
MLEKLKELEEKLQHYSHDQIAIEIVRKFAETLSKSDRQIVFGSKGVLVREPPILYQEVIEKGLISQDEDPFSFLQGDIISTDAAYFLGERLTGMKFIIASSTCDLIKERKNAKEYAVLFRINPITRDEPEVRSLIGGLLKFTFNKFMYLPRLTSDPNNVIANAVVLDGVVQIRLEHLQLATRHASLGLTGWRIFGSLLKTVIARTGESEVKMRTSINQNQSLTVNSTTSPDISNASNAT